MPNSIPPLRTSLPIVLLVALACAQSDAQYPEDRDTAFTMSYEWRSSDAGLDARGLSFFTSSSAGLASKVLVETPAERLIVLSNDLAVRPSWDRVAIRDDATGWWFEITQRYDVRAAGLQEFLKKSLDWYVPGEGKTVTYHARSRGGLDFVYEVAIQSDPGEMSRAFAEALRSDGRAARLLEEMPEGFSEAIAFLNTAYEGADKRRVIEVLARLTPPQAGRWEYDSLAWQESQTLNGRGVSVSDPSDLKFTSRFGSVDARNPLGHEPLRALKQPQPPVPGAP